MRRYPGRSRRLFEAPPPDLSPRRVRAPRDSLLAPAYADARFVSAYEAGVASWSVVAIGTVMAAFAAAMPPAIVAIVQPRDTVVRLVTGARPEAAPWERGAPPAVGASLGIFRVIGLTPAEALLTPNRPLLDVRVSLMLENDARRRWLTVTTVARETHAAGAVLLGPFSALHRWIMPEIVGEVARRIDTPKPDPPWSRLFPEA